MYTNHSMINTATEFDQLDIICFSHLRWNFVYQRPQHLLSRFAQNHRVFFVEEPVFDDVHAHLTVSASTEWVNVVVPHLAPGSSQAATELALEQLLKNLFDNQNIHRALFWYYTPMALPFTHSLRAVGRVYDCMDELSAFKGAPPRLLELEAALLKKADIVFTGGHSLYEAKKHRHPRIYPAPSSIDGEHFATARKRQPSPADQAAIPNPRLGFYGVIDERMDLELLDRAATLRPDWHWVIIGPVVKIDPASLPQHPNIHYLGGKDYRELPAYLSGWDVAILPFARNESTLFISPTKTPEYLAAGRPVVSTSIRDVVQPYGEQGIVRIADSPEDFIAAAEAAMKNTRENRARRDKADAFLANTSWNRTYHTMETLIRAALTKRHNVRPLERRSSRRVEDIPPDVEAIMRQARRTGIK
jgi:UDP-galactopyranose mutase